jgi:heat shock protein HslJ
MKITIFAMLTIGLLSCGGAKEIRQTSNSGEISIDREVDPRINDIWVAETIFGERFEPNGIKFPQLEISSKEKTFSGNDGCNNVGGKIKKFDMENLVFGPVMATKMACPDMEVPNKFNRAIAGTTSYKIQKLRLYLTDSEGKELMVLKKVD